MRFIKTRKSKDIGGLGLNFFNDKAGDANFSHTNIGLAGAYHKNFDRFGMNYFGAGMLLSYGNGNIDYTKLRFGNQAPPCPTCPILPSTQAIPVGFGYVDASAGVVYNYIPQTRDNHIQVGAAIFHLNQPKKSFYNNSDSRIARKYVFHSSAQIRVNSRIDLFPKVNVSVQGANREYMFGTFTRVDLDKYRNSKYGVYLGSWVRVGDAFILVYRMDMDQLSFAFSYDINTSSLRPASASRGGPELSVIYIGCIPNRNSKAVYCPRF
jgi:type IX secretion system PorP/SprF family membrane protein